LRAYTYPFQDNTNSDNNHHFERNDIHFSDVIDLYCFDRRLRTLIFNAIEKIEISIRTKIVYEYSITTKNSHWFLDKNLYHQPEQYGYIIDKIKEDVNRSNEDFVSHYNRKYSVPDLPPAWMTLETLSFGNLSKLLSNLDGKLTATKNIVQYFGLPKFVFFINWMHTLSALRNYCAHHSRIWNRRFPIGVRLPYNTTYPFIDKKSLARLYDNKLFASLSCIKYILNIISPGSNFKNNLLHIIAEGGKLLNIKDMGFPKQWQSFGVWNG
jgi:abortive infection bacteriophage resistance protein